MFRDPANLDYRLNRGSPCIGKASDGGDIGCRYTPEMIDLCKVALELRRKGILEFSTSRPAGLHPRPPPTPSVLSPVGA